MAGEKTTNPLDALAKGVASLAKKFNDHKGDTERRLKNAEQEIQFLRNNRKD